MVSELFDQGTFTYHAVRTTNRILLQLLLHPLVDIRYVIRLLIYLFPSASTLQQNVFPTLYFTISATHTHMHFITLILLTFLLHNQCLHAYHFHPRDLRSGTPLRITWCCMHTLTCNRYSLQLILIYTTYLQLYINYCYISCTLDMILHMPLSHLARDGSSVNLHDMLCHYCLNHHAYFHM